ncbi:hypothetical protein MBLNU457_7190t1 [Dothideomycetes sp. NU457]
MDYINLPWHKFIASFIKTAYKLNGLPHPHPDDTLSIPSRDANRTIRAHIYLPQNASTPTPILLNFHGSGYILPQHGSDDLFCRRVASQTPFTVIDCSYRLAPSSPFPAAPHDAEDAVTYVLSHPELYDLSNFWLCGFSAGGALALGVSSIFPKNSFKGVLAFYPPTDLATGPYEKVAPDTRGRPIPGFVAEAFNKSYLPLGTDLRDPLVSPFYIDPERFPERVLMVTCAFDSLCGESEELAGKIGEVEGKMVRSARMEECNHAWDKQCEEGSLQERERERAYGMAIDMLNEK